MIRTRVGRVAALAASASLVATTVGVGVDVVWAPSAEAATTVRVVQASDSWT